MHRLFVALRPPADQRARLIDVMSGISGARWQDDDQLHLTLRFIGEVDRHQANDIADALRTIRFAPIHASLSRLGIFERRGRADSLWIGASPREPLLSLNRKIERICTSIGLPPDNRAYLPHVTLARIGRNVVSIETFMAQHAELRSTPFTMNYFGLFESKLGQSGASYNIIERYNALDE